MIYQLLTAALAFASVAAAAADQPQPGSAEVVKVVSEPNHRMTVPVSIQGMGPYRFLIDTGAQTTVLSTELAKRLKVSDRRPATLIGIASVRSVETAAVDGLALGSRNINVAVAPLVDAENIGGADGVLGLDSLQNQRVLIDFKGKAIHVASAKELGGNRGYEIIVRARRKLGQLIITEARLDGVKVAVIIDTGAEGSTGNMALFQHLRHTRDMGQTTMIDINGVSLVGPMHLARMLSFDRANMTNLPILFTDSPTFHRLGLDREPALILGMEQLRLFNRVAIDFASRQVLFDLPTAEFTDGFVVERG